VSQQCTIFTDLCAGGLLCVYNKKKTVKMDSNAADQQKNSSYLKNTRKSDWALPWLIRIYHKRSGTSQFSVTKKLTEVTRMDE